MLMYSSWTVLKTAQFSELLLGSSISFTPDILFILKIIYEIYTMSGCQIQLFLCIKNFTYRIFQNLIPIAHTVYVPLTVTVSQFCFGKMFLSILIIIRNTQTHSAGRLKVSLDVLRGTCSNSYFKGFIGKVLCGSS